jgi:hypothetical protein
VTTEPQLRDLLAERIRRLESQLAETNRRLGDTNLRLDQSSTQIQTLVDLVGRLGRVVDVQGTALVGDEDQLERKVAAIEAQMSALAGGLSTVIAKLEGLNAQIVSALDKLR